LFDLIGKPARAKACGAMQGLKSLIAVPTARTMPIAPAVNPSCTSGGKQAGQPSAPRGESLFFLPFQEK